MNKNTNLIIERFKAVENMGFVPSHRKHNTGIGKTFEDYVGVVENNLDEPDLYGFEIKSHRVMASSYVTLFTKSPSFPKRANVYLKDKYGKEYEDNPDLKKIHASMFGNKYSLVYDKYNFKLINDRENEESSKQANAHQCTPNNVKRHIPHMTRNTNKLIA